MPTYTYECPACGKFDLFHGMKERHTSCPNCGSKVERVINGGGYVMFKGPGFHATDYAVDGSRKDVVDVMTMTDGDYVNDGPAGMFGNFAGSRDVENVHVVRGQFTRGEMDDLKSGRKILRGKGKRKDDVFHQSELADSGL